MVYKVTYGNQLKMLSHLLSMHVILFFVYIYIFGFSLPTYHFLWLFIAIFLLQIFPTILNHVNYLKNDYGTLLEINPSEKFFTYSSRDGISIKYSFDEIEKVVCYYGYGRGTGVYSFGNYGFCRIYLNNKKQIAFTTLQMPNMEEDLKSIFGDTIENNYNLLALIKEKNKV